MSTDSNKISKSPERMTFQKEGYIRRCEEKGEDPNPDYVKMHEQMLEQYDSRFDKEESRKDSLEYDLLTTDWILEKARADKNYAQNIYAALCNNSFIKLDVIPILTEKEWHCSWRYAGGIVADMLQEGDYIDWYCSGIRDYSRDEADPNFYEGGYAPEGKITAQIKEDFQRLGWAVAPGGDWENFE